MRRVRRWAWRRLPGFHPDIDALLAWADTRRKAARGWAPPSELARVRDVAAHLAHCARCRTTALRIARSSLAPVTDPSLPSLFGDLQRRMEGWLGAAAGAHARKVCAEVASRQFHAIEIYFGKEIANRLRRSSRGEPGDRVLVPPVEPLFHTFLGRRAAEALTRQFAG